MNYNIFYKDKNDITVYERTCGTEERAKERVEELKVYYPDAFYMIDKFPEKYFY